MGAYGLGFLPAAVVGDLAALFTAAGNLDAATGMGRGGGRGAGGGQGKREQGKG